MRPGGGRRKGAQAERDVVRIAKDMGFSAAQRTAPMQAGQPKEWADVSGIGPLWIEVKRERKVPVNRYARVYLDPVPDVVGRIPVLVWRDNGDPGYRATLCLTDLLGIVERGFQI